MANGWIPFNTTVPIGDLIGSSSPVGNRIGLQFLEQNFSERHDGMTYFNYRQGDIYTQQFGALTPQTRGDTFDKLTKVDLQPTYDVTSVIRSRR